MREFMLKFHASKLEGDNKKEEEKLSLSLLLLSELWKTFTTPAIPECVFSKLFILILML